MRKKYLIITGVKLLISQWHVNGLVGILSKTTFNLQLTQSSTLQLITILPIYYSVIILRKGRNRKIFYILNHWVFRELRNNDSEEKGERREGRSSWGHAALMELAKGSPRALSLVSSGEGNGPEGENWKYTRSAGLSTGQECPSRT